MGLKNAGRWRPDSGEMVGAHDERNVRWRIGSKVDAKLRYG